MNIKFTNQIQNLSRCLKMFAIVATFMTIGGNIGAEGSKDFLGNDGYRLFFWAEEQQQIKVYASEGEFINVGSSHVGIAGGFIRVIRPDGIVHATYDNTGTTMGMGIINDNVEEAAGPTGGGTTNGAGYQPGIISVGGGQAGIWTITFEYPTYSGTDFTNLLNNAPWTRTANQPTNQRVVLAWDVTVSQNSAANDGGNMIEGRVYSNEYHSILNRNGVTTSPRFYVLSRAGFQYQIQFDQVDPWGFPVWSNNVGLVDSSLQSVYRSIATNGYTTNDDPSTWVGGRTYLYEPQAEDYPGIINNKVFFNFPDPTMPTEAPVTDVWRNNPHTTWLFRDPGNGQVNFNGFQASSADPNCPSNTFQPGQSGWFTYTLDESGEVVLSLDIDDNGSYDDPIDRMYSKAVAAGTDSIFWDGRDGEGNFLPLGFSGNIGYRLTLSGGEIHIMLSDVENDLGGMTISRIDDMGMPQTPRFFYDHSGVGGPVSGGGTTPEATDQGYVYIGGIGNEKLYSYWTSVPFGGEREDEIVINIVDDCTPVIPPDWDMDGVSDMDDIDDDNDGVPDADEYCNAAGGSTFSCLPGGFDPSHDEDGDGIHNYLDADDAAFTNGCTDSDNDGRCDQIAAIFDTDGDKVPDHLDLDSDNDGITDLVEAGHMQPDVDMNGIIDGLPAIFGLNGLYNPIASDPDDLGANETYQRYDWDGDGVPDHDDLDSDNDGINDVAEAGYMTSDTNNDGRVDDGTGNVPMVNRDGLVPLIDPAITGVGIPLPPDWDGDGVPDWHDLDSDNDGINDVRETNYSDDDNDGIIGTGMPTVDSNGLATADSNGTPLTTTSMPVNTDGDANPDWHDLDSDDDGIFDSHEANNPDADDDGIIGTGTPTVNRDGQAIADSNGDPLVTISNPEDHDDDGIADFQDIDRDGDGIVDSYECEDWPCVDTDGDGIADVDDLDSDNDGLPDTDECIGGAVCPDDDGNGIDNFREYTCAPINTPTIVNISGIQEICEGESVNLTAGNGVPFTDSVTYIWTGPNGYSFTETVASDAAFSTSLTGLTAAGSGQYTLNVTSDRGCPAAPQTVEVTVNPAPAKPIITGDQNMLCAPATVTFTTAPFTGTNVMYVWSHDPGTGTMTTVGTTTDPTLTLTNLPTTSGGNYFVQILNSGCDSEVSDAFGVSISAPPVVDASNNTMSATPACLGSDVTLTATDILGATYAWTGPNGFSSTMVEPVLTNITIADAGSYTVVVTNPGCPNVSASTEVFISDKPETPVLNDIMPICAGSDVVLTVSNPVMGMNVEYNWFSIATGMLIGTTTDPTLTLTNVSNNLNGDVYVTVTVNGCLSDNSDGKLLDVTDVFNAATPTNTSPACEGGDVTLSITPVAGATYAWTGPNGFMSSDESPVLTNVTVADAGDYSVTLSLNGCTATSPTTEVIVTAKPDMPMIGAIAPVCEGGDAQLTVTNPPASGTVTYDWYDAATNTIVQTTTDPSLDLTNLAAGDGGDFYVIVTVNGCASDASDAQTLEVTAKPDTPMIGAIDPVCEGESTQLTVTNPPMSGTVTYEWYNNGTMMLVGTTTDPILTISNIGANGGGDFYVIVIVNGCPSDRSPIQNLEVIPTIRPSDPTNNSPACEGDDVQITGDIIPGATYSWTGPNGFTSSDSNPLLTNVTAANTGEYFVTYTVGDCSVTAPATLVIVTVVPDMPMVNTPDAICEGEDVTLTVTNPEPNATYEWFDSATGNSVSSNGDPTLVLNGLTTGGDYFVVASIGNCDSDPSDPVTVTVDNIPMETAAALSDLVYNCGENEVTLEAANPTMSTGVWTAVTTGTIAQPTEQTTIASDLGASTTQFAWTLSNGACLNFSSDTVMVVNESSAVPADDQVNTQQDELATFNITNNDDFGTVADSELTITSQPSNGTLTPNTDGTFTYTPDAGFSGDDEFTYEICNVNCPDQCSSATVRINVEADDVECIVPNFITPNGDGDNDNFEFTCLEQDFPNNEFIIYNRWGDKVYEAAPYQNDWNGTWDGNDLPAGTYFYCLKKTPTSEVETGYMTIVR